MINENLHNTTTHKPVKCDLIAEIIKTKDEILQAMHKAKDGKGYLAHYDSYFKAAYDALEKGNADEADISRCIPFLEDFAYYLPENRQYTPDVNIGSTAYFFGKHKQYNGFCKLSNGADILVLQIECEDCGHISMFSVLYFDGKKLRNFTPYEGNGVNVLFKTALSNERFSNVYEADLDKTLLSKMFPSGYKSKLEFKSEDDYDDYVTDHTLNYYGLNTFDDANGDIDAVFKEIETVLL